MTGMILRRLAPVLLLAMALTCLAGCGNPFLPAPDVHPRYSAFDPATEGIVDVETLVAFPGAKAGQAASETRWYTLANGQRIQPAGPFAPDAAVCTVPSDCFESCVDPAHNKVLNRLRRIKLLDDQGIPIPVNRKIEGLFRCLAGLEHDLLSITIFDSGGDCFACVELNVNWHSPYELYYYDRSANRLIPLYRWEGEAIVGLRVRNPHLLKTLVS